MSCERYWREGIVLVERGLDDPHRASCEDCTRAHASRQEMIEALPLIGAGATGDPHWQAKVWQRIDGEPARAPGRWRWQLASVLTVACALALWIGLGRVRRGEVRPVFEIIAQGEPMRSTSPSTSPSTSTSLSANVDDHLRITVGEDSDVWIYRAGRVELQCRARQVADHCMPSSDGMVVEMPLTMPGVYQAIVVKAPPVAMPLRGLDVDRAALESAGILYEKQTVSVH